ncbi:F-box/LRR-repeat protein 2 [Thelohanellus kitauei]|uniref:F-box/LRR-repeat protein 2 n=1 Tax=Thelohanellus kitauei TaxID=669202 RepID=A0A0C2JRV0_THEKT|nr:F-box/LRR-repeat protein 2 [Thelohanellus kitauei]KII72113.1 F-box/LRR-repeat protein 2 [Thelohanellus kitauei]
MHTSDLRGSSIQNLCMNDCRLGNPDKLTCKLGSLTFGKNMIRIDIRNVRDELTDLHTCLANTSFERLEGLGLGHHLNSVHCPPFDKFNIFISKLKNLRILDCYNLDYVNDETVKKIAENLENLEYLGLRCCRRVYGTSLDVLLKRCTHLRSLILSSTSVDNNSLIFIDWASTQIEELDLSCCEKLTDAALISMLPALKNLEYLCLNFCGKGRVFSRDLVENCSRTGFLRKLKLLSLLLTNDLTFKGFEKLCTPIDGINRFENLTELSLRCCRLINTNDFTRTILTTLPNLKVFEIGDLFHQSEPFGGELHHFDGDLSYIPLQMNSPNILQVELYPLENLDDMSRIDRLRKNGLVSFIYNLSAVNQKLEMLGVYNRYYSLTPYDNNYTLQNERSENGAAFRSISHLMRKCRNLRALQLPNLDETLKRVVTVAIKIHKETIRSDFVLSLNNDNVVKLSNPRRSLDFEIKKQF